MNTRKCKKCGWEVPATQRGAKCPVCREPYEEVVCSKCGKLVSGKDKVKSSKIALCRECHNATEREHMVKYRMKHYARLDELYEQWLEKVQIVPKSYPTLTEEQWLEACR